MFAKFVLTLLKVSFVIKILNCYISVNVRRNSAAKIKGLRKENLQVTTKCCFIFPYKAYCFH